MPYCPKCGVQVDYKVRNCPLCNFPMPKITPEEDSDMEDRFPSAYNIYPLKTKRMKRALFSMISIIFLCGMFITVLEDLYLYSHITWSRYIIVSIIAAIIYIFFLMGFINNFLYSLIGISINSLLLLFFLDIFDGELTWALKLGFPCVIMCTLSTAVIFKLLKMSKRKGFNIVAYIIIALTIYCLGIDAFISLHVKNVVSIHWSVIVSIVSTPISLVFLYLHFGLPEKFKTKLKKKFHI